MSSAANLGWHSIAKGGIVIPRPPAGPRERAQRGTPRDPVALSLPPIGNRGDPGPCTPRRGDPTSFRDQQQLQQQPQQHRATPRRLLALQPKQPKLRHSWPGFVRGPQGMGHRGSLLLGGRSEGRLCQPRLPAGEKGGTAEGGALPGAEGDPAAPFSLCLTPEAIGVLQKRRLAQGLRLLLGGVDEEGERKRRGQAGRGRGVGHVASGELVQGLGGEIFSETEVPNGLLRISLLNDRHRYDDVEYEDDDDDRGGGGGRGGDGGGVKAARTLHVDAGVRDKCVTWLRGLEEARGGHSLPHLIL